MSSLFRNTIADAGGDSSSNPATKRELFQKLSVRIITVLLVAMAVVSIVLAVFLWFDHLSFPLNLEAMEGTVLQHVQRAASLEPVYTQPDSTFVALAYNPLYYVLTAPFTRVFGASLSTLRLVSIIGAIGSCVVIYLAVYRHTTSRWWALMAMGLFAAAYGVMDYYVDTAHADSWLLLTALLGTLLIDRSRSFAGNLAGILVLVLAFWFKQHGALFVIGGVLFLAWREGILRAIPYALIAGLLGPILYLLAGPALFGPYFIYFTLEVPRSWSVVDFNTFRRYGRYLVRFLPVLTLSAGVVALWTALRNRKDLHIWHFQLVFALFSGFMGTLDPGSQNNVYIPMATWIIIMGTLALYQVSRNFHLLTHDLIIKAALLISFAFMSYNPVRAFKSPDSYQAYTDLVTLLKGLDGPAFAPDLGQLQSGYTLYPATNWVSLYDMVRGPGHNLSYTPSIVDLLEPATEPKTGRAYLLQNWRITRSSLPGFLLDYYVLDTDLGDRFASLSTLPSIYGVGYPRYLYRYDPAQAAADRTSDGG